ncbi:MAG: DUF58 domain-containing protein [Candidatus Omnitrophica bacterium]|nr:DUF58 domain-containing protein [Candidatus Omnitrophota bacterium]
MLKSFYKRWLFISIITIFNLVIALKTSLGFFYFFFWGLVAVVVLSLAWLFLAHLLVKVSFRRQMRENVFAQDTVEIKTEISNNSPFPLFNLVINDYLTFAAPREREISLLVEYLRGNSSLSIEYNRLAPKRGKYLIGPFVVYFFDPLGLFFLKRKYNVYNEIYIYPNPVTITKFPPLKEGAMPWFGLQTARARLGDDEFFGTREYKDGDPVKTIHWISSARKNKLIVKEFQNQSFFRATILFNLRYDYSYEDSPDSMAEYMITLAASVAKYLISQGVLLEVVAHTGELVRILPNKGQEHMEDILRFLAAAEVKSEANLGELFEDFSRSIPSDSNVVVIMPDKDWQYMEGMFSLERRSVSIIPLILASSTFLYSVDKKTVAKDIKNKLSQAFNFTPILLSRGDNLEEAFLKS